MSNDTAGDVGEGADANAEHPDRSTVEALLTASGLRPPPEEVDRLAGLYGGLRRSIERFHAIDAGDEVAAAVFRAAEIGRGPGGGA